MKHSLICLNRALPPLALASLSWLLAAACSSSSDSTGSGDGDASIANGGSSANDVDGGNQNTGNAGSSNGGSSNNNAGSGGSNEDAPDSGMLGQGGAAMTGPGIPEGEAFCLVEVDDVAAAFYFGAQSVCHVYGGGDEALTADQLSTIEQTCMFVKSGTLVDAYPDDPVAAYCVGSDLTGGGLPVTKLIYESAVNPDADTVARNAAQVCLNMTLYGTDDVARSPKCTGTLSAKVDGEPTTFTDQLFCSFRTDGNQTTYSVRGTLNPNSLDLKELSLKVVNDGSDTTLFVEALQPPFGYLEGSTAAGAFTMPDMDSPMAFEETRYESDGSGFAGTFEVTLNSASSGSRVFTDGEVDITLSIE